jgi:hypothetical protein
MYNDKKKQGFSLHDGLTVKVEKPGWHVLQATSSPLVMAA